MTDFSNSIYVCEIHPHGCIYPYLIPYYCCVVCHCLASHRFVGVFLIYSSTDAQLLFIFQFGAKMEKVIVNNHICVFCQMYAFISLEYMPRNEISGSWSRCSSLVNIPDSFPKLNQFIPICRLHLNGMRTLAMGVMAPKSELSGVSNEIKKMPELKVLEITG